MNYTNEELMVYYKGKPISILSPALIAEQNIDRETLEKLKLTYIERAEIFESMENTDDVSELKALAKKFDELQFRQQALWGFPQNENFHRWFDVPKCECPKMDNMENLGTKYRITVGNCPIHGTNEN